MKTSHSLTIVAIVFADLVAGIVAYSILPNGAPIHWNIRGEVDRLGPPWELAFVFPAVAAVVAALTIALPKINRIGSSIAKFPQAYGRASITIISALVIMHGVILMNALGWPMRVEKAIPCVAGLLIAALGNSMGKLRRNPIIGIRTPWTLADDTVWERTHRAGGVIMVVYGLAILASAILTSALISTLVVVVGALTLATWSFVYSWRVYRQVYRSGDLG